MSAPQNGARVTVLHLRVVLDHPDWVGDGQDDLLAVQAVEYALAKFNYEVVEVEVAAA